MEFKILLLLIVANGAPVAAWKLLGNRFAQPVDNGALLGDGRPVFGTSKTLRGIAAALLATPVGAEILGMSYVVGLLVGAGAMTGDLLSSFVKRRLAIPSGGMLLGVDQIPEALVPLLLVRGLTGLGWLDVAMLTAAFLIAELLLSWLLYQVDLRKTPY
jgi:hypothetical protein